VESLHIQVDPKQASVSNEPEIPFTALRQYIPQDVSINNITLTTPDLLLDISLQLTLRNYSGTPLAAHISLGSDKVTFLDWKFENLKGDIFLLTEDAIRITVGDSSTLQFGRMVNNQTSVSNGLFTFSTLLQKDLKTDSWLLLQSKILATTEAIQHNELSVQLSPVSLSLQGQSQPLQLHAELHENELRIRHKEKQFILQELQATLLVNENDIDLKAQFIPEIAPVLIQTNIKHNLSKGAGTARISTSQPLNLQKTHDSIQKIIRTSRLPLNISGGIIEGNALIQWDNKKLQHVQASFNLKNGTGSYDKILINGLEIQQDLELFPSIKTRSNGYVSASEIFNGITLRNLSMHNQLLESPGSKIPRLLIESVQAEIFGGIVSGKQIDIKPQQTDIHTKIHFNKIDLHKIVELSKVKGLNVTGILDGTIQLQIKDNVVTIPNGEIHSREPGGTINYFPPGGSAHYSTLPSYALKALEEFNYSILAASPTYHEDGSLIIAIHMEGYSPPLETERPVHLNLNTEQNILSLLESLRYSNKLTNKLEEQLQTNSLRN
jgi:hypothetical protein